MNLFRYILLMATLTTLLLLSGCGDVFKKQVKNKSLESNKFKADCELSINDFTHILENPIAESIDCLGQNLHLFRKSVESQKPGHLSRIALENYIERNRKDINPEMIKAVKSVFDINYLVYGEDPNFLSEENIDALVKFAKIFNAKAAANYSAVFKSDDKIDYENFRVQRDQRIRPAALAISSALKEIFNDQEGHKLRKINLIQLLESFETPGNTTTIAKAKKLLFMKKIILGGSQEEITHVELSQLVKNFSSYVLLALDAVRYKDIRLDQESMIQFLNTDLELLNHLLFSSKMGDREHEVFFTLDNLVETFKLLSKNTKFDLADYYDLLIEAKQLLMEGDPETITGRDLKKLFNHGMTLLKTGTLYHRFWSSERAILEARPGRPLTYDFKNLYDLFKNEKSRVDDFVRILKSYRYMKGENIAAYYTDEYRRNPSAVFEIAIYEYVITMIMKKYGCPNNNVNGKYKCDVQATLNGVYMEVGHITELINKFRKVIIGTKLIYPGREIKTAETVTLLGSLFQNQSDENKVFDVNEATEFAISLVTSLGVAQDINDYFIKLSKEDKCQMDDFNRFSPECFDRYFFEGLCLNYPDHFPKLFEALGATVYESNPERPKSKKLVCKIPFRSVNLALLKISAKAGRPCTYYPNSREEVYYTKSDIMTTFLAIMHIETTIIRWDKRVPNNFMDPAEVMDAYHIYSPALDGFLAKKSNFIKKLKKQIFQYLVKYEQVPEEKNFGSTLKFLKFLLSFKKEAPANRKTISSILLTIGEQGTPSTFDCNVLRDPENIPDHLSPDYTPPARVSYSSESSIGHWTSDDFSINREIEKESDASIKAYLNHFWPEILRN